MAVVFVLLCIETNELLCFKDINSILYLTTILENLITNNRANLTRLYGCINQIMLDGLLTTNSWLIII